MPELREAAGVSELTEEDLLVIKTATVLVMVNKQTLAWVSEGSMSVEQGHKLTRDAMLNLIATVNNNPRCVEISKRVAAGKGHDA